MGRYGRANFLEETVQVLRSSSKFLPAPETVRDINTAGEVEDIPPDQVFDGGDGELLGNIGGLKKCPKEVLKRVTFDILRYGDGEVGLDGSIVGLLQLHRPSPEDLALRLALGAEDQAIEGGEEIINTVALGK